MVVQPLENYRIVLFIHSRLDEGEQPLGNQDGKDVEAIIEIAPKSLLKGRCHRASARDGWLVRGSTGKRRSRQGPDPRNALLP